MRPGGFFYNLLVNAKVIKTLSKGLLGGIIITSLSSLVLLSGGFMNVFRKSPNIDLVLKMGYPGYFSVIIGAWTILGVIAILIPRFTLVKEWAYAGFVFLLTSAIISHLIIGDNIVFQIIILLLIVLSWYLRPLNRKVQLLKQI
jgi:hypothetical protein